MVVEATLKDYQNLSVALDLYMRFNGKDCSGGTGWCGLSDLTTLSPGGSAAAKVLLWPAYLGMRLSYGFWLLGPRLFGYRMRLVVENGVPSTRLVKVRGRAHAAATPAPKSEVAPRKAPAKAAATRKTR